MRHDITVHRQYYRLHDSSVELAKISKILLKVDGSDPEGWKGCRLDDINLNLNETDTSSSEDESQEYQETRREVIASEGIIMEAGNNAAVSKDESEDGDTSE